MKFEKVKRYSGDLFIAGLDDDMRVRYWPSPKCRKNTIITLQCGDIVFFGISRCNFDDGDHYSKQRGLEIAIERVLAARKVFLDRNEPVEGMDLHTARGPLCGWCRVMQLQRLDIHFRHIDNVANRLRRTEYKPRRRGGRILKEVG